MKKPDLSDFPFADLLGFQKPKEEELTDAQKFGKKLLEIAKQHKI